MKYGDIIFLRTWWNWVTRKKVYVVRFRVDPIPHCGGVRYKFKWYHKKRHQSDR